MPYSIEITMVEFPNVGFGLSLFDDLEGVVSDRFEVFVDQLGELGVAPLTVAFGVDTESEDEARTTTELVAQICARNLRLTDSAFEYLSIARVDAPQ